MPGPIPRVIHQVWLNGEPPDVLKRLQERMMRMNPGYELKVWTPKDFPPLYNQRVYETVEGLSYKSDIARYEILWRHPGIYVDYDVVFWRGFDDIFGDGPGCMPDNFFVRESDTRINNAIFGVGPGSPIATALVQRLDKSARIHEKVGGRAWGSGVVYFTRVVKSFPETAVVWPAQTFHPRVPARCALKAASDPKFACIATHFYNNMPENLDTIEQAMLGGVCGTGEPPPPRQIPPSLVWRDGSLTKK